jgi:uncharacterized protein with FMN-binding domain
VSGPTRAARPGPATSPARVGLGLASLALAAVLLLGFKAPQDAAVTGTRGGSTNTGTNGSADTSGGTSTTGGTSAAGATSGTGSNGSSGTKTVDGPVVDTRYGPVQVEITVTGGKITAATAIELPSGGRSGAISQYVAPILSSEALAAQSAQIDLVSGATYTSDGYAQSLQSALDQARA